MLTLWSPQWTVWAPRLSIDCLLAETTFIPMGSSWWLSPWPSWASESCTNAVICLALRVCCRPAFPIRYSPDRNRVGGHLEVPFLTTSTNQWLSSPQTSPQYLLSRAPRMYNRTFLRKVLLHRHYMFHRRYYFLLSLDCSLFSWIPDPSKPPEPTTSCGATTTAPPPLLVIHQRHPQGKTKKTWWKLSPLLWNYYNVKSKR